MTLREITPDEVKRLRSHPLAKLFPAMQGERYQELLSDVREHGITQPIVLDDDNLIVDGRNRRNVCEELGIGCPAASFSSLGIRATVEQ